LVVTGSILLGDEVLGSLVSSLEIGLELVESVGSGNLGGSSGLGSSGLKGGSSGGMSLSLSLGEDLSLLSGEWVESVHHGGVGEWVLLGLVVDSDGSSNLSKLGLNLIGVDDSGKIGAGHDWSVHGVSGLLNRVSVVGSEEGVQLGESSSGENNESSEMSSWSKLDDVESSNVAGVDTWEVSSGLLNLSVGITVDDEWSLLHDVSGSSVLSGTGSSVLVVSNSGKIISKSDIVEGGEERLGVWNIEVVNNKWELWNILDLVTSGHHKRSNGRSGESSSDGMSSLGDIDSSVPVSPDLEWGEHSSLSAHVTESGLSRS